MQGPNPLLSEAYGTASVQAEPTIDESSVDAFVKVAMEQGWDLDELDQMQTAELFQKVAEAMEESSGEAGDEIEAAADDLAQAIKAESQAPEGEGAPAEADKQASLSGEEEEFVKTAEQCDFMGRIIAHAQWDELKKLAEAEEGEGESSSEEEKDEEKDEGGSEKKAGRSGGKVVGMTEGKLREILHRLKGFGTRQKHKGMVAGQKVKEHLGRQKAIYGGGLAGLGAGAAGGYAAGKTKSSEDEAFQALVVQKINEKFAALQYDDLAEQIADRTIAKLAEEG